MISLLPVRIDLNCQGKYPYDNHLEPEELIEGAITVNLDGVCFAEHRSITASKPEGESHPRRLNHESSLHRGK